MRYRVTSHIRKDGADYPIGSEIELNDAMAERISHAIEGPIDLPPKPDARVVEVATVFEPLPEITEDPVVTEQVSEPVEPEEPTRYFRPPGQINSSGLPGSDKKRPKR